MVERTDEQTRDVDVDELLDDDLGGSDVGNETGTGQPGGDAGTEDLGVDVDALTGEPAGAENAGGAADTGSSSGFLSRLRPNLRGRIGNPLAGVFSVRSFGVSLALTVGLMLAFSFFVPFIPMSGLVGVFLAAFGLGLLSARRRYLELGIAGAAGAAIAVFFDYLVLSLMTGNATTLAAFGAGGGAVAALIGHYFGRDLRSGLTRDV